MPPNVIGLRKSDLTLLPLKEQARANAPRVVLLCLLVGFGAILIGFLLIVHRRYGTVMPNSAIRYIRSV